MHIYVTRYSIVLSVLRLFLYNFLYFSLFSLFNADIFYMACIEKLHLLVFCFLVGIRPPKVLLKLRILSC